MVRRRAIIALAGGLLMFLQVGFLSEAQAQTKLKPGQCCPVKIKKSGSYILTGNLEPGGANTDAISISAPNVTLDLGGYSIRGPSKNGSGVGINAGAQNNVTVENGGVSAMGSSGIVLGNYGVAREIQATGNGTGGSGAGIQCVGASCFVSNCIASGNGSSGLIFLDASSGYQDNVIQGNLASTVSLGTDMGGNVCNGVHGCP
jgi:hypothetical protein